MEATKPWVGVHRFSPVLYGPICASPMGGTNTLVGRGTSLIPWQAANGVSPMISPCPALPWDGARESGNSATLHGITVRNKPRPVDLACLSLCSVGSALIGMFRGM